jgi:hypothetical protein
MGEASLSPREIRTQVERRLRRSLADDEWDLFVEMGSVGLVEDREEKVSWLVERIRGMLARIDALASKKAPRAEGRSPARPREDIAPSRAGDAYAFTRQDALCVAVAALANADPEVTAFRREALNDLLLTYALDSSREGVEEWVPQQIERERPAVEALAGEAPRLTYIRFIDRPPETTPVAPEGVLDRLRMLGDRLAARYRWASPAAAAFVLTGDVVPDIAVLTATIQPNHVVPALTRIALTIDPAATPADVTRAYRQARARIAEKRAREMQPKTLFMAAFAAERQPRESLKKQMAAWNAAAPDPTWRYVEEQAANFVRDRNWALARLVRPAYKLPEQEVILSYDKLITQSEPEPNAARSARQEVTRAARNQDHDGDHDKNDDEEGDDVS